MSRRPVGLDHDDDQPDQHERRRQDVPDHEQRPPVFLLLVHPLSAPSTRSSCSAGFTLRNTCLMLPSGPMTNVERSMPMYFFPYIDFSTQVSYLSPTEWSSSPSSVNGRPYLSANARSFFG